MKIKKCFLTVGCASALAIAASSHGQVDGDPEVLADVHFNLGYLKLRLGPTMPDTVSA